MVELPEAITGILRREGADHTMVLGARLGAIVREEHGDLLREEMERQGSRFVQLVEGIEGVRVVRDAGSGLDVFIGLEGAVPPSPSGEPPSLRSDVYAAFTRFGAPHSYEPASDRFREGPPGEGGVECPEIRQSDLVEIRSAFAATLGEPTRSELLAALDGQEGSLTRFRVAVTQRGLLGEWHQFQYETLTERVREWAAAHDLQVQPAWFVRAASARERRSGPRQLLQDLANSMTDEEARSVRIPVATIERYLRRQRGPSG